MKMKIMKLSMLAITALVIGLTSCSKDPVKNTPTTTKVDSILVPFSGIAPNTFFSFSNGSVVANSDSATTKWDFGVRFVNFIVNSHASGPGNAAVITQRGIYENFTTAPESGYAYDTSKTQLAINADDPGGWYHYDPTDPSHTFYPLAGQFFVFRTTNNHYVKMEILSVGYAQFIGRVPVTLIYRFRYTYQPDGSRNF